MADENDVTGAAGDAQPAVADDKKSDAKGKKTGVGAGRPHGVIGAGPKKTAFENTDAELLWPEIIVKLPGMGHQLHELAVRVIRVEPPPKEQVGKAFEASAIVGDSSRLAGDVLIQYVTQYYHLPFPWAQGTAQYELQWCWKSSGEIFARGGLRLPSRDQIAAAYDAEWRQRREGSGMMGSGMGGMGAMPQMPMPPPPMPPGYGPSGYGQGGYSPPGFGAPPAFDPEAERAKIRAEFERQYAPPPPPVHAPLPPVMHAPTPTLSFDHEAERAKIRAEIERDMEMQRMRDELASLKRDQRSGFAGPPRSDPRDQHFQPPQSQYAPQRPPEPQLSPEVQIARIVVQTLAAMGVVPPNGQQQQRPVGVGAPMQPQGVVAQAETGLAALEALTTIFDRTRKVTRRLEGVMGGETSEQQQQQQQQQQEQEQQEQEEEPRMGTQLVDVGTSWRDGRPVKAPIDPKTGDIRYDQQGLMAGLFGNPIIGEGVMDFLGALKTRMMQTPVARSGVGSPPAGGEHVQVRQVVRTEQPQQVVQPQPEQLPPNGTGQSPWSL